MATQAARQTVITYTGDVDGVETIEAAANVASPGAISFVNLTSGFNSISVPGGTPVSVTILPPAGNTTSIILKGITGDTGIQLHDTDPTTIAIDSSVTAIGLTVGANLSGVRLYWT